MHWSLIPSVLDCQQTQFYCSTFKLWTHEFDRYENTVRRVIALLAQLVVLYLSALKDALGP